MTRTCRWIITAAIAAFNPVTVAADQPRVVGYVPEWKREYRIADIPADRLTHINYAFGLIKEGKCSVDKPDLAAANFEQLKSLKQKHPGLKTLVSVGGWTGSSPFSDAALTAESRETFARSCAEFASEHSLDGVDIDWEFPGGDGADPKVGRPEDTRNFTSLLAELRKQLDARGQADNKQYLLTIAAPAGKRQYSRIELAKIHPYLDFINIMTYDLSGPWSQVTDHNAPLYSARQLDNGDPAPSADATVRAYLAAGVPAEKLLPGLPFYGHAWTATKSDNHGLFQPHAKQPPKAPPGAGDWTYRSLKSKYIDKGPTRYWDDQAKVPWLFDPDTNLVICYDDPQSIEIKSRYARDHGLGGVMFWELSQDDEQSSLLNAIHAGLTGK